MGDDGVPVDDVWSFLREPKFDQLPHNAKENAKYPTQKPKVLLERIIRASSNEGDIVLDPFCRCGTTVEAAYKLNRQFIGIDIFSHAIDLILTERMCDRKEAIPTFGIPRDFGAAAKLAKEHLFDFESWAVARLPGFVPSTRQRSDGGVDGRGHLVDPESSTLSRLCLAQVKEGRR